MVRGFFIATIAMPTVNKAALLIVTVVKMSLLDVQTSATEGRTVLLPADVVLSGALLTFQRYNRRHSCSNGALNVDRAEY